MRCTILEQMDAVILKWQNLYYGTGKPNVKVDEDKQVNQKYQCKQYKHQFTLGDASGSRRRFFKRIRSTLARKQRASRKKGKQEKEKKLKRKSLL